MTKGQLVVDQMKNAKDTKREGLMKKRDKLKL